jgi:hypothetical protein
MTYKNITLCALVALSFTFPNIAKAADAVPIVAPPLGTVVTPPQALSNQQSELAKRGTTPTRLKADQNAYTPLKYPDQNPYEGKRVVNLDKQDPKKPGRLFSVN